MDVLTEIKIEKIIYGSADYEESLDFRNEIFRKPQGLDIRNDDLENEKKALMFGARINGKLVGTIFLEDYKNKTARIRAVAVAENFRKTGLGKKLMDFAENLALKNGYKKIFLTARTAVSGFYAKRGYTAIGEPFLYKKIPHIGMEKTLTSNPNTDLKI